MKTIISFLAAAGVAHAAVQGFDISHYQSSVNYAGAYNSGARFVMIKVSGPSPSIFSSNPHPGNRGNHIHRPVLLNPLHGSHQRRPDPRRLPLRPARHQLRRRAGQLFPQTRRRLDKRRHHAPGNAGYRVQPVRRDMLRAQRVQHGGVDLRLRRDLQERRRAVPHDLHHGRLVEYVHRQ